MWNKWTELHWFRVDGRNRFEYATFGREKKCPFSNIVRIRVDVKCKANVTPIKGSIATLIEKQLFPVNMDLLPFKETFIERILMAVFFGILFVLGACWWWSFGSVVTSHIRFNSCINTAADTSNGNWRNCVETKVWSDQQGLGSSNWYPCFLILIELKSESEKLSINVPPVLYQ